MLWLRCGAGYAARKRYAELRRHMAATTIQRYERMRQSRIRFLELRSATIAIQTSWRGAMARDLYKRMRRENAAVRIQVRASQYLEYLPRLCTYAGNRTTHFLAVIGFL